MVVPNKDITMIKLFKDNVWIVVLAFASLGWSYHGPRNLNLGSSYDLFQGDWLDTWEDPKDSRFVEQGIDLKKSFEEAAFIREELYNIRQKFAKLFNEMQGMPGADYFQLEKDITKATIEFTVKYLDKAKPASINKDEIAFISFGSMARGEAGIVTDLEGSLLWDDNVVGKDSLGLEFGQSLSNLLDGLIGHPIYGIRGFRLDEADHSPFHRAPWARTMSLSNAYCMALKSLPVLEASKQENKFRKSFFYPFEGSWVYTNASPNKLASYIGAGHFDSWPGMWSTRLKEKDLTSDWYQWAKPTLTNRLIQSEYIAKMLAKSACGRDLPASEVDKYAKAISLALQSNEIATISNFPQLSRNRAFIYGNKELFRKFEHDRREILNENNKFLRKKLAMKYLNELVKYIEDPKIGIVTAKAPDVVDIKRYNYRFEEQLYTNLAFLLDLDLQNQGDIIKYLSAQGIIGKEFGKRSFDRVNQIIRLRLKKQIALQTQLGKDMLFLTNEAHASKLKKLEDELAENQNIVNDPLQSELAKLEANNNIMEIKSDLKLMPKLIPGNPDSIFTPADIDYIRNVMFPEQNAAYKRLIAFLKDNKDVSSSINFDAFKDSFLVN